MKIERLVEFLRRRKEFTIEDVKRELYGEKLLRLIDKEAKKADKRLKTAWKKIGGKGKVPSFSVAIREYLTRLASNALRSAMKEAGVVYAANGGEFERKVYKTELTAEEEMARIKKEAVKDLRKWEKYARTFKHYSSVARKIHQGQLTIFDLAGVIQRETADEESAVNF